MESRDNVTPEAVQAQLGGAYDRFGEAERRLHLRLLRSIERPEDVAVDIAEAGSERRVVTVCAADLAGALSVVAGLFAAYRSDVVSADIFTLHFPRTGERRPPRRPVPRRRHRRRPGDPGQPITRILDIFEVRLPAGSGGQDFWDRFREELDSLMQGLRTEGLDSVRGQVIDRFTEAARAAGDRSDQLFPVAIEMSNDASPSYTRLAVRSTDTIGFLFSFANALTMARVNIERAEIRTVGGEARDIFWLTDPRGRKITDPRRVQELRAATALIKQMTHLLPRSPNPAQALRQFHALTQQVLGQADWPGELRDLSSPAVLSTLTDLLGVSRFLWEDFLRMQHENLFPVLVDVAALDERWPRERLERAVEERAGKAHDHPGRVAELNGFKDREMFRIDLRHMTGRIGFRDFSEELTELAEVVIAGAARLSIAALTGRQGFEAGPPCAWCVCALGKFGGRELGFGSDIELVFVYDPGAGRDDPGATELLAYFDALVGEFRQTVSSREEGIFEIDLRLRPYGGAGALASSLSGFRRYYSQDGPARQFERMALVKLRPVAGDAGLGSRVAEARDSFVYSGLPVDIQNVLHLRRRQASELVPQGAVSAKYSPGGLVDLEYFVQAMQLSAGGADPAVRATGTIDAIERLAGAGRLADGQARDLAETYGFLRRLIDSLRVVRGNAKDLTVPDRASRESGYLALRLGFGTSERLHEAISERMGWAAKVWDTWPGPAGVMEAV